MVDIEKKQEPKTLNSQKEISKGKSNSGESKNAKNESQKQITAPIKSSND